MFVHFVDPETYSVHPTASVLFEVDIEDHFKIHSVRLNSDRWRHCYSRAFHSLTLLTIVACRLKISFCSDIQMDIIA